MRSLAREVVFKYMFSQLFNHDDEGLFTVLAKNEKLNESDFVFANELLGYVLSNYDNYLSVLDELAVGYRLNRVFNVDKCAIVLGMAELDNCKETPLAVIIDEAVKLAGKFSTEKSTDFVNGVLSKYAIKQGRAN